MDYDTDMVHVSDDDDVDVDVDVGAPSLDDLLTEPSPNTTPVAAAVRGATPSGGSSRRSAPRALALETTDDDDPFDRACRALPTLGEVKIDFPALDRARTVPHLLTAASTEATSWRPTLSLDTACADNVPAQVADRLWIGSQYAALNAPGLSERGITHIINCCSSTDATFPADFKYLSLDLKDLASCNILACLDKVISFAAEGRTDGGGGVFVHCKAGRSRSAAIVAAILMAHDDKAMSDALSAVQRVRPMCHVNDGFYAQLQAFDYANCNIDKAYGYLQLGSDGRFTFTGMPQAVRRRTMTGQQPSFHRSHTK